MFHKQPTKTSGTIGTYVRIGRTLLRRASKMERKGEMVSITKISKIGRASCRERVYSSV